MTDLMLPLADFTADPDRYLPIDVRDEAEFLERHIPGAINVPLSRLQSEVLAVPPGKVPVTVCGKGGGRSTEAAAMLRASGHNAVWLESGTTGWFESNVSL